MGEQHRSREGQHAVPTVAFDYVFVTDKKMLPKVEKLFQVSVGFL